MRFSPGDFNCPINGELHWMIRESPSILAFITDVQSARSILKILKERYQKRNLGIVVISLPSKILAPMTLERSMIWSDNRIGWVLDDVLFTAVLGTKSRIELTTVI